ncbi:MAG: 3-deoxy-D-manno-octulosonate 8-phosphate phosphatase [Pseudomonadota bacterium]
MSELLSVNKDNPAFAEAARKVKFLGIDFDGVMTDNSVFVFEDGREAVRCSRLEGFGIKRLKAIGVEPMIISTEKNPVVSMRAEKLKIDCIQAVEDKVAVVRELLARRGLEWSQAGFIGNDINDAGVLTHVGLPVVVADAHPSIEFVGAFRTLRVGGDGAVRQVCDEITDLHIRDEKADR